MLYDLRWLSILVSNNLKTFKRYTNIFLIVETYQRRHLLALLRKIYCFFANLDYYRDHTYLVKHDIHASEASPIRLPSVSTRISKKDKERRNRTDMFWQKVVELGQSHGTPTVVVAKKSYGSIQFHVDCKCIAFSLSQIDETINIRLFSWQQVLYHLKLTVWLLSRWICRSSTSKVRLSNTQPVVPLQRHANFFVCNTVATFERIVETVLRELSLEAYLVYFDDAVVV